MEKQPTKSTPHEKQNYISADGLVEIITKTRAKRYPQHNYPVVCLRLRISTGSRIQALDDGSGVEVLLSHKEMAAHLAALNAADGKAAYTWKDIPEKSLEQKAHWWRITGARRLKKA